MELEIAITDSQNFFFRSMSVAIFEREGILASSMGIDNQFFNLVLTTNLTEDALIAIIPEIEAFFKEQQVPWTWTVFPFSEPAKLVDILQLHGMQEIESFTVMGMELADHIQLSIPSVSVLEVKNSIDFDKWSIPLQEGFESTEEKTWQFRKLTESIPYGDGNNFHHYVLYIDNAPIAAGTVSLHKGNARLDNIAVRPAYQKNGFGTALTNHMLFEAKRLGAKYCFLDASHEGAGIYKKLGFRNIIQGGCMGFYQRMKENSKCQTT